MERSVVSFVRPKRRSFPFVSNAMRITFSFQSSAPATPSGPPTFAQRERSACSFCRPIFFVASAMRSAMASCCFDSFGRRVSASRHRLASRATSLSLAACCAPAEISSSRARWMSAPHDGQIAIRSGTSPPHPPQGRTSAIRGGYDREWTVDRQRDLSIDLPRFEQAEGDDENADDVLRAREKRSCRRDGEDRDETEEGAAEREVVGGCVCLGRLCVRRG